jgi:hypothetical protein
VGARLSGHASLSTLVSKWASANFAREDCGAPVRAISFAPVRLTIGTILSAQNTFLEFLMMICNQLKNK